MSGEGVYRAWVSSYCGDYGVAVLHGYATWESLPDKAKKAWGDVATMLETQTSEKGKD